MPRFWVRVVFRKDKPNLFQAMFKAKCRKVFKHRERADKYVELMNLLVKED